MKNETNEQQIIVPTNFEALPELNDIIVCPSETGSNSYECLLEAILLPMQFRDIFVGLRSPWKGGDCCNRTCFDLQSLRYHLFISTTLWAAWDRKEDHSLTLPPLVPPKQ
jgi:hypothetical protein